jgi:hypothetical protein
VRAYHLTSAAHALANVALKRLKISRFGDLNDPFELLAGEIGEHDYRAAIKSWKSTFHTKYGLLCFSRFWKNPVLWSHYAEKHRGVALGFELDETTIEEVQYLPSRIPIRFVGGIPGNGLEDSFVRDLLRTKFEHWRYEDEVRVFVELDEKTLEGGAYFYPFDSRVQLREVILGPACELPLEGVRALSLELYGDAVIVRKARLAYKSFDVVPDKRHEPTA